MATAIAPACWVTRWLLRAAVAMAMTAFTAAMLALGAGVAGPLGSDAGTAIDGLSSTVAFGQSATVRRPGAPVVAADVRDLDTAPVISAEQPRPPVEADAPVTPTVATPLWQPIHAVLAGEAAGRAPPAR